MDNSAQKVIATAGLVTLATGTLNSLHGKNGKNGRLPSVRFLIGTGVAFFIFSAIAEAEPELAKSLAIAVTTTVLLGEGGGALTYIDGRGETDTTKGSNLTPKAVSPSPVSTDYADGAQNRSASIPLGYQLTPQPGL